MVHNPLAVACAAVPPSSPSPTCRPVNSATICGPDTKATASAFITTKSASPRSSAGPDTTGPVAAAMTGTWPLQREIAAAARPHPCRAATPSWTSAPLDATKNTNGMPRFRAWSAASASRTPSAYVMAPRRMEPSARQMTTLRPSIRPTTEVTAPTMPLPTSTSDIVVIPFECRPFSPRWPPAHAAPTVRTLPVAPLSHAELARLSDAELMDEAAATSSGAGVVGGTLRPW